jgi:predicted permease
MFPFMTAVLTVIDTFRRDIRHGLRMLRRNPTFTAVVLLTLAIGIGANSAVFTVVNSVLLKPLAYPDAEQLVAVRQTAPGAGGLASVSDGLRLSPSMYFTYSDQNHTFQALGVWAPGTATVTGLSEPVGVVEPEEVRTVLVSDGILQALRVPPALGRWLGPSDQIPGGPLTVMLGYSYWQRRFGGDRSVLGRSILVDSNPREIAGVMPPGFQIVNAIPELILPRALDRSTAVLPGFGWQGIARLKPGVTLTEADADLARLVPIWMNSWPLPGVDPHIFETWRITPALRPLKEEVVGNVGSVLWVVMGTVGIVMLIACANVANLLLVRAEARQQELALRAALGAGRAQIVRTLLVESLLLGLAGGVLGVGLASWSLRLLTVIGPVNLPRLNEILLDGRALGFTLVVSLISGLLFGSVPALKYAGGRISMALRSAGRTASLSRERHRARNVLVVAQVALALVLLVSAGLMIRTFQALRTIQPGFTGAAHLQTLRISIPAPLVEEPERVTRLQNEIVDKLEAIPGVTSAGFASAVPMEGIAPNWDAVEVEGKFSRPGEIPPMRLFKNVSPGFLDAIGARIVAGRELTWTDVYGGRRMAMVSENLARELWGSPSAAVGKRFVYVRNAPWWEVAGVVEDVRENGVDEPAPAIVYWPTLMDNLYGPGPVNAIRSATFAIRSDRTGSESFLKQIREAVGSANASLPVAGVRSMQEIYSQSLARTSFTLVMLAIAGAMALVLGVIGIYGVISYSVSQRQREIGIRLALGAQQRELRRMFVRHGLVLAGLGLTIGIAAAAVLTRLMSSLLFGISPLDPMTYAAGALVLALSAILASYLPARRASAVDPVEALKSE